MLSPPHPASLCAASLCEASLCAASVCTADYGKVAHGGRGHISVPHHTALPVRSANGAVAINPSQGHRSHSARTRRYDVVLEFDSAPMGYLLYFRQSLGGDSCRDRGPRRACRQTICRQTICRQSSPWGAGSNSSTTSYRLARTECERGSCDQSLARPPFALGTDKAV